MNTRETLRAWRQHCDNVHDADGAYRLNVKDWHRRHYPECDFTTLPVYRGAVQP